MEDVNILVPIGDRDVNELRLFLAIFGAEEMEHDSKFISVRTCVDSETIARAANLLTEQIVVDAN